MQLGRVDELLLPKIRCKANNFKILQGAFYFPQQYGSKCMASFRCTAERASMPRVVWHANAFNESFVTISNLDYHAAKVQSGPLEKHLHHTEVRTSSAALLPSRLARKGCSQISIPLSSIIQIWM
ncbi:hypothetical protein TNCV_4914681 [Trichonephila clavipes]|nr:hypothetical protein TNCV_4914681 [Trichonephila clavipes]